MSTDLAERYREQAVRWATLDGHARKLEEMKTPELAKRVKAQGDKAVAAAERDVRASQEWHDLVSETVQARTSANLAWAEMDYLRLKLQTHARAAIDAVVQPPDMSPSRRPWDEHQ